MTDQKHYLSRLQRSRTLFEINRVRFYDSSGVALYIAICRRATAIRFKRSRFKEGTLETTGEGLVPSMLLSLKELYARFQVWVVRGSSA